MKYSVQYIMILGTSYALYVAIRTVGEITYRGRYAYYCSINNIATLFVNGCSMYSIIDNKIYVKCEHDCLLSYSSEYWSNNVYTIITIYSESVASKYEISNTKHHYIMMDDLYVIPIGIVAINDRLARFIHGCKALYTEHMLRFLFLEEDI